MLSLNSWQRILGLLVLSSSLILTSGCFDEKEEKKQEEEFFSEDNIPVSAFTIRQSYNTDIIDIVATSSAYFAVGTGSGLLTSSNGSDWSKIEVDGLFSRLT